MEQLLEDEGPSQWEESGVWLRSFPLSQSLGQYRKMCLVISQNTFHFLASSNILFLEVGWVSLLSYKYISWEVPPVTHIQGWWSQVLGGHAGIGELLGGGHYMTEESVSTISLNLCSVPADMFPALSRHSSYLGVLPSEGGLWFSSLVLQVSVQGGLEPWESPELSHARRLTRDCRWPRWCGEGTPIHGTADCGPAHGWVPTGLYFSWLSNWWAPAQTPGGTWWGILNASSLGMQRKRWSMKAGSASTSSFHCWAFPSQSWLYPVIPDICAVWKATGFSIVIDPFPDSPN